MDKITANEADVAEINRLHRSICNHATSALLEAIQAGELLNRRKEKCLHGEWIPWLKANVEFSETTARVYIRCYENKKSLNQQRAAGLSTSSIRQALELIGIDEEEKPEGAKNSGATNGSSSHSSNPPRARSKRETREHRLRRHRRRVELNGLPEILKAFDNGEIAPAMAETIANFPKDRQLSKLEEEKKKYAKKKANSKPATAKSATEGASEIRTGKAHKPDDHIPYHLLGDIITGDLLVKGRAVCKDEHGGWCDLPAGISKLRRDEEVATMIGGSEAFGDRKAYYKWQMYDKRKIEDKILKLLEQMSPLEIPKGFKVPAVTYQYDLNLSCDLRELADMLYAQLIRRAEALENKERFGHLYAQR